MQTKVPRTVADMLSYYEVLVQKSFEMFDWVTDSLPNFVWIVHSYTVEESADQVAHPRDMEYGAHLARLSSCPPQPS